MQSFEVYRTQGSAELREHEHLQERIRQEQKRKKSLTVLAILFIVLLILRILERPVNRQQLYEEERMGEEAIAAQLMMQMQQQMQQQEQYRLVPSEMIPGLPPGGLVKVRVPAGQGQQMGGMPMEGMPQGIPLGDGRMLVMKPAPMHDPNQFRMNNPVQDPNMEAHNMMAQLMAQGIPPPIASQMVMSQMADGAGDHGNTGGMERKETPELLTVEAHLPGHHILEEKQSFDASETAKEHEAGEKLNPLDIKLLDRTILIRGTTRKEATWMGPGVFVTSSFQRALWLPANAITSKIECDYGRKSGNLVIKIPKDPTKPEKDDADEDHPQEDQARVEKIRASFEHFQERVRAMQAAQEEGVRGPDAVHGVQYDDLKQRLEQMHEEGTGLHLEESAPHMNAISKDSVEYLGCFQAWDLPKHKKELPFHAASSFARSAIGAIHHAQEDQSENLEGEEDQYFFAMARHDAPHKSGKAFTFKRFDHQIDSRHGVVCGNHCDDDGTWFCGALGDVEHHSAKTEDGVDGAMFAVYALKKPKDISTKALDAADAADHAAENAEHPTWKLVDDFNGGDPKVEIIVPKDSQTLKYEGKTAIFYKDDAGFDVTVKVILPMEVFPEYCEFGEVIDNSATRVVTCYISNQGFHSLKVNVKEEL